MTIGTLFEALTPPGFCSGCGRKLTCRWRHQGPPRNQLRGVCPRCEGSNSVRVSGRDTSRVWSATPHRGASPTQGAEVSDSKPDTCVHHWMLETPKGKTVAGTCAHCGGVRSFPSEHNWREPTPEERAQRRAIRLQSEQELTDVSDSRPRLGLGNPTHATTE